MRSVFLSIGWPIAVACAICGALATALYLSAEASDKIAQNREQKLVTLVVSKLQASVAHDQESTTVWDDAVTNTALTNVSWMETNLGQWMNSYFGHDGAFVLGPDLSLKYEFINSPVSKQDLMASFQPLAQRLKARLLSGDTEGISDRILSIGETDIARVGTRPAVVSVKPVISDTGNIPLHPDEMNLHVAIRYLDRDLPLTIGSEYQFDDFHFAKEIPKNQGYSYHPLASRSGQIMGYFAWQAFEPGTKVIEAMRPVLLGAFAAIFAAAVTAGGVIAKRSSRLAKSRTQLLYQARHDGLTGLVNRTEFTEQATRAGMNARANEYHAVLFIDLDKFKEVNDTLGHPAGDELLRQVAKRLRHIAPNGVVARIGGDEFTMLIKLAESDDAEETAAEIVRAIRAPFELAGKNIVVGASVGVCSASGPFSASELIRKADIALYHAKTAGKNTFALFGSHMDELVQKRRSLESDLRAALRQQDQLQVFYQPVLSGQDGKYALSKHSLDGNIHIWDT